ncbi:MAG: asparagine--tRNA ligase [Pseudomonadota bacterium]
MSLKNVNECRISSLLAGEVNVGLPVCVKGWVRTRRDSKAGISFLMLHDGSCFDSIQVVAPKNLSNYEQDVLRLTAGCSIIVDGELAKSLGKGQAFEIQAKQIIVVGWVDDPDTYPISPKHHTVEYLREHAHLRPRTNIIGAVTRIQNCVAQAIHRFLDDNGFYWIHTPIITASDCEGAGELFRVSTLDLLNLPRKANTNAIDFSQDFFGRETFLTVSGQLEAETYCLAMSKVYTFGPTFRAENSNTTKHLAEFWMIEPEIAFADLEDAAMLAENLLKYIFKTVLATYPDDMNFFVQHVDKEAVNRLQKILDAPFVQMEYSDAIRTLERVNDRFEFKVAWGSDLQTEHERYLTEVVTEGRPVIVQNYPQEIKAFYMRMNQDHKTVAGMDILVPGFGEIVGGAQREERLTELDKRLDAMKIDKQNLWWYRDLRRYGSVPHAGFGIGFERLVGYVTGVANIRDIIPFPRVPNHAEF